MTITITDGTTPVTLPEDLLWSDEYTWSPVVQAVERSITGALIVNSAALTGGRPITLEPEDDSSAWMSRTSLDILRNWAAVPDKQLTLTLRGQVQTVVVRHQDGGISARPVVHYSDSDAADQYLCTIRLLTL